MPLYYFHLYDGCDWVPDTEGIELADGAAVEAAALSQARDVMAGDIREGRIDLNLRIVIDNESGERTHMLRFADALTIAPLTTEPLTNGPLTTGDMSDGGGSGPRRRSRAAAANDQAD